VTINEQGNAWVKKVTDGITPSTRSLILTFRAPFDLKSQAYLIDTLRLVTEKTQGLHHLELRLMSEHFFRDEMVRYLTSDEDLLRRIKTLKFHFTLPHQAVRNLLDNLSSSYQHRKSLKYLGGTELAPEVAKVYLAKPQSFPLTEY
jgi:hypothetical protein